MSEQNIRHMNAHRFPCEEIPSASEDHFLVSGEYTESRTFNLDGTKVRRSLVLAHGTREQVKEEMERRYIDNSLVHYRSSRHDDEYFRSGIENTLDEADEITDAVDGIEAVIGHRADEKRDLSLMKGILMSGEWERDDEYDGLKGRAIVTPAVMNIVNRVEKLFGGEDQQLFRRFEVTN